MSLDICLQADVGGPELVEVDGCDWNMTHNVTPMWRLAGVYESLYESKGQLAGEHIEKLRAGVNHMKANPDAYKNLNPANGWGSYEVALKWLKEVLTGFERCPKAIIWSWG